MASYWYLDDTNDNDGGSLDADVTYGYGGNDTLGGQAGNDILYGGLGNDELYGDEGNDTLYGEAGDDSLTGGSGSNTLDGGLGNDTLEGSGVGSNLLIGGLGNDTFLVYGPGDIAKELAGGGIDKAMVFFNGYTLADQVENLELTGGATYASGNALNNLLIGNSGDNSGSPYNNDLSGGAGNDSVLGQAGEDFLSGDAGNDALFGQDGNDFLRGGAGNDSLQGGFGVDTMQGGAGNDTYVVDDENDSVSESDYSQMTPVWDAGGVDTIESSVSYDLWVDGGNVENLTLTESGGDIHGQGNGQNNVIKGNSGHNQLSGGGGNDSLYGGAGDDTFNNDWQVPRESKNLMDGGAGNDVYYINPLNDKVVEGVNGGNDTVHSDGNYTLGANVENLVMKYNGNIAKGNELANDITGNEYGNHCVIEGLAGNDTLRGGNNQDILDGGSGIDSMIGGTSRDTYYVDDVADKVEETELGDDYQYQDEVRSKVSYTLSDNVEFLYFIGTGSFSGTGNDSKNLISGGIGNDILSGLAGSDTLDGGAANDSVDGGVGDDRIYGGAGNDSLYGGADYDRIWGDDGNDYIDGGDGRGRLIGGAGNDTIKGGLDRDQIFGGDGNDSIDAGAGTGEVYGGAGNDFLQDSNANSDPNTMEMTIEGGAGNDTIIGGAGSGSYYYGGIGDDFIDGGEGIDNMNGGEGNDTYVVDNIGDGPWEGEWATDTNNSNNKYKTTGGIDTVRSSVSTSLWNYGNEIENLVLIGQAEDDLSGAGNGLNNRIDGDDGDNRLEGHQGNDTLYGGKGNDLFDELGAEGQETYYGGEGDDTFYVDNSAWQGKPDTVVELAGQGIDTVYVQNAQSYTLGANLENLVFRWGGNIAIGNVLDNIITYEAGGDGQLYGLAGNDTLVSEGDSSLLDGGLGNDSMVGGDGNDVYRVDSPGDIVDESGTLWSDFDRVESTIDYDLSALTNSGPDPDDEFVEELTLLGVGHIDGTGNELDNRIYGNVGNNWLDGKGGYDVIDGGAGNDTIVGGDDENSLSGGVGNDSLLGGGWLDGGAGNDILTGWTSDDNLSGGIGNDILGGGDGMDYLDGGQGIDVMVGGEGSDFYIIDNAKDNVTETGVDGYDRVMSSVNFIVTDDMWVEGVTLTGTAVIGTGNKFANDIEGNNVANKLYGNDGDDELEGYGGNDSLFGGAGKDWLEGGVGKDSMVGGLGSDGYEVDDAGDLVVETDDEVHDGSSGELPMFSDHLTDPHWGDVVASTVSYVLPTNVEFLVLDGWGAINGTGNGLANVLLGNFNNNTLDGKGGDDTLYGGGGDDTYILDSENDQVFEVAVFMGDEGPEFEDTLDAGGNDTVFANFNYDLGAPETFIDGNAVLENLTLYGTDALTGDGNGLNNVLTGNGNSALAGHVGDDTYIIKGSDTVTEQVGEGDVDTIITFVPAAGPNDAPYLADDVENLILGGTVVAGRGNVLDNQLFGNDANNFLAGGDGNDLLQGGKGADTLFGQDGNDIYYVDNSGDLVWEYYLGPGPAHIPVPSSGDDVVYSSVSFTLDLFVEDLHLVGTGIINGTGNTGNNTLIGNSRNNTLSGGLFVGLSGGEGNDILNGKGGNDTLKGGADADTYVFDSALNPVNNVDVIDGFVTGEDEIELSQAIFDAFSSTGYLTGGFVSGDGLTSGSAADDYIIFNTSTGALYYDANGNGGAAVQFATIKAGTLTGTLTEGSFYIVA